MGMSTLKPWLPPMLNALFTSALDMFAVTTRSSYRLWLAIEAM